jgi:hypothetical protein
VAIHPRHKIDENSLTAYRKLVAAGRITERDAEVMDLVRRNPGSTAIELADAYASTYHLRVPYPDANLVRPSITRLVQQGWLKYGPNKKIHIRATRPTQCIWKKSM